MVQMANPNTCSNFDSSMLSGTGGCSDVPCTQKMIPDGEPRLMVEMEQLQPQLKGKGTEGY